MPQRTAFGAFEDPKGASHTFAKKNRATPLQQKTSALLRGHIGNIGIMEKHMEAII